MGWSGEVFERSALVEVVDAERVGRVEARRPGGPERVLLDARGRERRRGIGQAEVAEDLARSGAVLDRGDDVASAAAGAGEELEEEDTAEEIGPGDAAGAEAAERKSRRNRRFRDDAGAPLGVGREDAVVPHRVPTRQHDEAGEALQEGRRRQHARSVVPSAFGRASV